MPTQGHTLAPGSDSLRSFRAGTCVLLTTVFRALDGPNAIGLPSTIALRGVNLYHVGCYSEAIKERRLPVGREDSKCSGLCRRRARDCSRAERTCNRVWQYWRNEVHDLDQRNQPRLGRLQRRGDSWHCSRGSMEFYRPSYTVRVATGKLPLWK